MEYLIIILLIVLILSKGSIQHKGGGCNIKDPPKSKRPDIIPAPQPK